MNLRTRHIARLAASLALACSISLVACAQRERTTPEDYAAAQSTEQEEKAKETEAAAEEKAEETKTEEQAAESTTEEQAAATEAETEEKADAEEKKADTPAVTLNTEMLMASIDLKDRITSGNLDVDEEALAAIPDYEGDEYVALDALEPEEISDVAATKAASDGVLWYTSGIALVAPDHWNAYLGSDEIDFEGTKYGLFAIMQSWDKANWGISSAIAADLSVTSLSESGYYNIRYLDKGEITIDGNTRGSYAQILADYDWKGATTTYVIEVNYLEGKTKMNYLGFLIPASDYSAAVDDIGAVWNSLGYVSGESF